MKSIAMLSGILAMFLFAVMDLSAQQTPDQTGAVPSSNDNMAEAVQVRHWLDRTAMFPGDRVNYYLEISCAADTDILLDDLDASQLSLTGLEVVSSDQTRTESDGRVIYHVRYSLTTYDLNTPSLQIGPQTIRYFARRTAVQIDAPAGEIVIPSSVLSLRSTLAAEPMQSRLRDSLSSEIITGGINRVRTTGLVLILISGVPVAGWALLLLRQRASAMRQHQTVRTIIKADHGVLEKLRNISASNAVERRQGYDQLDQIVRDLLAQLSGIQTNALTAAEIAANLSNQSLTVPVDQLASIVEDCERARYGRPEQLPTVDRFEAGIDLVRRLLIAH